PQWRGPSRDGHATVFSVPEDWPEAPKEVWKVEVGEGYTSPVIADGRVFLMARQGDDEVAMALDPTSGKVLWTSSFPTPYMPHQAAVKYGSGPKSTPAVANGVVCFLGIDSRFSCHRTDDGKVLWVRDFSDKSAPEETFCGSGFSPLIDGDTVYIHLGDDRAGRLFAADLRTGEERWAYDGQGPGYASPFMITIDGVRQFVTFATTDLLAFDPATGELLWNRHYPDKWRENIVDPLVVGERILITDFENGTLSLWPKRTDDGWVVEDHWHNKELTQRMASPVTDGKLVYGFSDKRKGQLFVLDPANGKVVWSDKGRGGENVTMTIAGEWLFVLTTGAELKVFARRGQALEEVERYEIASSSVWAQPAWLADGLLVKDERHLARLALVADPEPATANETATSR
ncbi:MAG: PQQ-binding-like beta-propeller repeat protein, partial [Acidobacteriota bacterium]